MKPLSMIVCVLASLAAAGTSCSSSSGAPGGGSVGDGGSGSNEVTYCCIQAGVDTLEVTVPQSELAAEQAACTKAFGTYSAGPCPAGGYAGCCDQPKTQQTQCYFPSPITSSFQNDCTKGGGTWVAGDAGASDAGTGTDAATGPDAFVGTWLRGGTQTVTCPTGNPNTTTLAGDVIIALGSASGTIALTAPDGCVTSYAVTANVATAASGQTCNTTTEAGVAEAITTTSHTLTLAADGQTMVSDGTATIDKTEADTMCTLTSSGTFTKQ
jgi:hypothetical protein